MRVLALYTKRTLPIFRRIVGPFDVLAKRGHTFNFQEVIRFEAAISYGYDVTLFSDWVLPDDEFVEYQQAVRSGRSFVYDLTDPLLLENPRVQDTLRLASFVTVPTDYLKKEVGAITSKVKVLPSTIDMDYFMTGRTGPHAFPRQKVIGCYGNHDWSLVKKAIEQVLAKHGEQVIFLGDHYARAALGKDLIVYSEHTVEEYPRAINACLFGLCPFDGDQGVDPIVPLEYGILCKPVIITQGSWSRSGLLDAHHTGKSGEPSVLCVSARDSEQWVQAIELLLGDRVARSSLGRAAYLRAKEHRTTKLAGEYLSVYAKMLPHTRVVV